MRWIPDGYRLGFEALTMLGFDHLHLFSMGAIVVVLMIVRKIHGRKRKNE
jgi:hypothetical protein